MLYYSRWDSPEAAHAFAKLYAHYLPRRYKSAMRRSTAGADLIKFDTDEGKAIIEISGSDLLILEGFDDTVAERTRDVILRGMPLPDSTSKGTR